MGDNKPAVNLEWKLNQVFGGVDKPSEEVGEADIVSAVEFDDTGDFLAAGDKGGRIVLFKKDDTKVRKCDSNSVKHTKDKGRKRGDAGCKVEFKFFQEFQSHMPEFDYLKSLEIEEKINKIRFLHKRTDALLILTTNGKISISNFLYLVR